MNANVASMQLVGLVAEVHQLIDRVVAGGVDNELARQGWEVSRHRLDALIADLVDPSRLDSWEDTLTSEGLTGPEFDVLVESLHQALRTNDVIALEIASLLLDAIGWLPGLGVHARPVATFARLCKSSTDPLIQNERSLS